MVEEFKEKDINEEVSSSGLVKTLSFPVIVLITINSILGTGIYFLPALGAKSVGAYSIISWVILSFIAIYIGMIFAELVGMFPVEGGVYEYSKQAFGSFTSFLIGWLTLIAANVTLAMLIVGAIRYLNPNLSELTKISICIGFIVLFNYLAFRGMKTSAVMLLTFGFITLGSLLGLIIPSILSFNIFNFSPPFSLGFGESIPLIFFTIFLIAETFFGWETATFLAAETKDAKHTMPKAMILATVIIALISLLFVVTSLAVIPWQKFGEAKAPLTMLATIHYGATGSNIFTLLVYLSIIGTVAGWIVSTPRLILALAKDRLFIPTCAKTHPKYKTPHNAILFQTILASMLVIIGTGSYETLLEMLIPMVFIMYSVVFLSLVVLRYKKPELERPYKIPFGKTGPILVIVIFLSLIVLWIFHSSETWKLLRLGILFMLSGIPIFFIMNLTFNPDAIRKYTNMTAKSKLKFKWFFLPKKIRDEIFYLLGDIKGKYVVEIFSGAGILTEELVKKAKTVTCIDFSMKDVEILKKRAEKNGWKNLDVIYDPHLVSRVHPEVDYADAVVSVGFMHYSQDFGHFVHHLSSIIPNGGRVCFMDYRNYFWFIPNIGIVREEEKLKKVFEDAGFSTEIIKVRTLFWSGIIVSGIKGKKIL